MQIILVCCHLFCKLEIGDERLNHNTVRKRRCRFFELKRDAPIHFCEDKIRERREKGLRGIHWKHADTERNSLRVREIAQIRDLVR